MNQEVARVGGKNEADFFNPPNIPDSFKKAVGVVQVAMGRLGFLHRKVYNVLLANAYEGLGQGKTSFAIPVRTLAELSGFESNDFQMLYDHGLDLVRTEVEFIDFDSKTARKGRGKRRRGATTLISDFVVVEGSMVTYSYSPEMAKKVYEPEQYVWMAISAQNRFSSKYEL
ncbi:MAG: hypothetical protein SVT56_13125, partial [Chloroflexota bacterium]|nr:hypothetical protein [Chloroflexota bacterium]